MSTSTEAAYSARMELPPTPASVPLARRVTGWLLRVGNAEARGTDAEIVVRELVTNVIDHVGGEARIALELAVTDGRVRIAVVDGSAVRPVVRQIAGTSPRGRGMRLVAAIADRWGVDERGAGKVWVELDPGGTGAGGAAS